MTLEKERQQSDVDVEALTLFLHGAKTLAFRKGMLAMLSQHKIFDTKDDYFLDRPAFTKLSIERSFETYRLLKSNKELLAMHSPMHGEGGGYVGSFGTPSGLSDHFALFVGTLLTQATPEQQRKWILPAVHLKIIGTYAQTELGHGSNVRGLETTATYDQATDEFIMDSPTISSAKWWPGALGLLATHAVLYARLIVDGKDIGYHAFMVPLRDEQLRPLPGVEVGDLGPKLGYGAYDSGFLRVHKLRIPRFNMLARFQRLEKGGQYIQAPKALQKLPYLTMLKTRVFIAHHAGSALAKVLTIVIRYTATRRQGFVDGKKSLEEHPILDHNVLQDRLMPLLATVFAIDASGKELSNLAKQFEAVLQAAKTPEAIKNVDASVLPALHATSAGMKAFFTQMGCNGMEEARKCCGGHGYTLNSGLGMFIWTLLPSITYEGDMVPMALQTARYLMKCVGAIAKFGEAAVSKMHPLFAYLGEKDRPDMLPQTVEDFKDRVKVLELLQRAARAATKNAAKAYYGSLQAGATQDIAIANNQVLLYRAAQVHTLCKALYCANLRVAQAPNPVIANLLSNMCALFGLEQLKVISPMALTITPDQAKAAAVAKQQLCTEVRKHAVKIVDSFGITDAELNTTMGNYNNDDMYERMVAAARKNPINTESYQRSFHSELLAARLNKEFLKPKLTVSKL